MAVWAQFQEHRRMRQSCPVRKRCKQTPRTLCAPFATSPPWGLRAIGRLKKRRGLTFALFENKPASVRLECHRMSPGQSFLLHERPCSGLQGRRESRASGLQAHFRGHRGRSWIRGHLPLFLAAFSGNLPQLHDRRLKRDLHVLRQGEEREERGQPCFDQVFQ